jgi:hypothetical protein
MGMEAIIRYHFKTVKINRNRNSKIKMSMGKTSSRMNIYKNSITKQQRKKKKKTIKQRITT